MSNSIEVGQREILSDNEILTRLIRTNKSYIEQKEASLIWKLQPPLVMTPALQTLFETPELWLTVDKIRYSSAHAVQLLLERRDGILIDRSRASQRRVATATAIRKKDIEETYGVRPLAAINRHRYQLWDENFSQYFFASLQRDLDDRFGYVMTTVAYKIRDSVDPKELLGIVNDENKKLVQLVMTSEFPYYRDFRANNVDIFTKK